MSDAREDMERWGAKLPIADYLRFQKLFSPALTEARREVLCEAAAKIRAEEARMKQDFVLDENEGWAAADAADLIDPDKT